jgi:hypothetical protein
VSSFSPVRHLTEWITEPFELEEVEVEVVLRRLDRLTQDEARAATAQSLDAVCRLVQNMSVVMDREQLSLDLPLIPP